MLEEAGIYVMLDAPHHSLNTPEIFCHYGQHFAWQQARLNFFLSKLAQRSHAIYLLRMMENSRV